jgi:phage N-6-adenine-methyltransferase
MPGRKPETGARLPGVDVTWLGDQHSSDEWYTPPLVFDALALTFDVDPATIPGGIPWIPADRHYSIEDDGLTMPWVGRVWLNPPYSSPSPWIQRLAAHGDGIALIPADTSTAWWHDTVPTADAVCFIRGRLRFVKADLRAAKSWTGRFPSALVAWGDESAVAVRACGLGWTP